MRRILTVAVLLSVFSMGIPVTLRAVHRRFFGVKPGVTLEGRRMEGYYGREVWVIVEQLAANIQRPPKRAGVHKETGEIIPHENGIYVDIDATVNQVLHAPKRAELKVQTVEIVPDVRTEHLEGLTAILGDFSTPVMGSPARVNNIRLSLEAINNTLVLPGEVFSFNGVVGERTPEKGYRNAPIILGEAVVPGVGGGICQTSTTLYNAVRAAGLEIVERRIHSIAPSYIQHGRDATVAWPHTDFKFRNNSDHPVIIKAGIQGWRVRVWIVGRKD